MSAAAAAVVAGCSLGTGAPPPPNVEYVLCPNRLVTVDLPRRPAEPTWGEDDLAALATAWTELDAYADGLEEQSARRGEQMTGCRSRISAK